MFVKKTTKYYKEVSFETTITPKYKCYVYGGVSYLYYNVIDGKVYTSTSNPTTDEATLSVWNSIIESISEDSITISYIVEGYGQQRFTFNRSTANDFGSYTTTTTTTIPGTPDDYTYKEDVLKHYAITKGDKKYILTHNGKYY